MPRRHLPLITGEIYHVYNRGIDRRTTFTSTREYQRAVMAMDYYRYVQRPFRLSWLLDLKPILQQQLLSEQRSLPTYVEVLAYCLMSNHFHLLLKQSVDGGISTYLSQFQNSHTRYHNLRDSRQGPLFMPQFRAVRIESEQQLVHVSRYIHCNPLTAGVITDVDNLKTYQWSSLTDYLHPDQALFIQPAEVLHYFDNDSSAYWQFLSSPSSLLPNSIHTPEV